MELLDRIKFILHEAASWLLHRMGDEEESCAVLVIPIPAGIMRIARCPYCGTTLARKSLHSGAANEVRGGRVRGRRQRLLAAVAGMAACAACMAGPAEDHAAGLQAYRRGDVAGAMAPLRRAVERAVEGRAVAREVVSIPPIRLGGLSGLDTTIVAYTTDIPALGPAWGKPFLLGPGSIHVAHTLEEHVEKRQLIEAVGLYRQMVSQLLTM